MKKTLTVLLIAILVLCSIACGKNVEKPAEQEANAPAEEVNAPAEETFKTLGDVLDYESLRATCYEDLFVFVFEKNGIFYRADAEITADLFEQYCAIDFFDEQKEQKEKALLADLPIRQLINLSSYMPKQEELDALSGKTGTELLEMGFTYGRGYNFWDKAEVFLSKGLFEYQFFFNEKVPEMDDYDSVMDEIMQTLTVDKVEIMGISDACIEHDINW